MKIRIIITLVVLLAAPMAVPVAAQEESSELQAAREALNKEQYEKAAQLLEEIYEQERDTQEAGNALYWRAFAYYRMNKTRDLKYAAELLRLQQEEYRHSETAREGEALLARLYGELAERGEAQAAREIREMSEDERRKEETRAAALHALMRMDPERAMPILKQILSGEKESSPELRRNAVFILCQSNDDAARAVLLDLLNTSDDAELLADAVMCLAMQGDEASQNAIIDLFERVDDPALDEAALFAMGQYGNQRAIDVLVSTVRDETNDIDLRAQALFALSQSGQDEQVMELATEILTSSKNREMQEMALHSMANLEGDVPNEAIMQIVNNPAADDDLRAQALFLASQRGQVDLDMLMDIYRSADSQELKLQICHVITQMDDEEASMDALIAIAREETDPEIRQNAVFWVGQYDSDKAADFLLEMIEQ